jgi:hypothetical protein
MANEIQTITVPDFVGASGYPYFGISWPNYINVDAAHGASTNSIEGLTAAQVAEEVETNFNSQLEFTDPPATTKTISVTGALDGTSLVLTVEFDGPGVAGTNVEQGFAADWGDIGEPVIATVQDGGPSATAPEAIDDLAATPGANKLTFTYSQPDDGGATITKHTLYLDDVEYADEVTSPHVVTGLVGGVSSGAWTVTSTNSEGESDPSNEVTATPIAPSAGGFRCGLIK